MKKTHLFQRFAILITVGLFLSGCSFVPAAWKSSRPAVPVEEVAAPTSGPTQTVEQLDAAVTADLETSMDADLKQIDEDLKVIESEAFQY